jgi:deoxyribodipyrimidine photo-lyase
MLSSRSNARAPAALVLVERDLRLADHDALAAAARHGPVTMAFVLDDPLRDILGGAQKWWLHHSLAALNSALGEHGGSLALLEGRERAETVAEFCRANGINRVFWNRREHVFGRATDEALAAAFNERGLETQICRNALLHDPKTVRTGSGSPFRVYTPFWRAVCELAERAMPAPVPESMALMAFSGGVDLASLGLLPQTPDWSRGLAVEWTPGEAGAHERLAAFVDGGLDGYREGRNRPDQPSTSRLSPHLAFGEITPAQIISAALKKRGAAASEDIETFLKEVVWREFSYHLLAHKPDLASANFNGSFDAFPWNDDVALFAAWRRGRTGYPIVDAGMRELWQTGWMHNRVRMIAASFLTKHALIDWRRGERWFWDTLVDADPASNAASWQWVAGSGADAAPYFRIFNPILQGEKFDPEGVYVRRFVPELAEMPAAFIHRPWEAPPSVLAKAGVRLGATYPEPVISHDFARRRALAAYQSFKEAS